MQNPKRIYLDSAAATALDRKVFASMRRAAFEAYGNPSSLHGEGVEAKKILAEARRNIADILHAHPDEIIFTSGGTESNNLAVFGALFETDKPHIIVSNIEHPSVLASVEECVRRGAEATFLPVDSDGIISAKTVQEALKKNTVLVSIMHANNEIGTIQPIREIAKTIRDFRKNGPYPLFHTDACQSMNYLEMNVSRLGVDLMTLNGSKIYGPKGIGALFIRDGVKLAPLIFGGGQERGLRSGTENLMAIAGFSEAMSIAEKMKGKELMRLTGLREFFIHEVLEKIPDTLLNGSREKRLPNNANLSFLGLDAEQIVIRLDAAGISCSAKSACANADDSDNTSHVVQALGGDPRRAASAIRFTLGRFTRKKDLAHTINELTRIIEKMRACV